MSQPALTYSATKPAFYVYTIIFINEGHYLLAFLWTYAKVAEGVNDPSDDEQKQEGLKNKLIQKFQITSLGSMRRKTRKFFKN